MTVWERLICSMISVNQWDIKKTLKIIESMRANNMFEIESFKDLNVIEIGSNLKKSGYDRGSLTYMIAERLIKTSVIISKKGVSSTEELLSKNTPESKEFLKNLNGIGPKTIDIFFSLK